MSDIEPKFTSEKKEKTDVNPQQRDQMIAEAAYRRAEQRGFAEGDMEDDWLKAEAEIDRILQHSSETGSEGKTTLQAIYQKLEIQLKEWDARFEELKGRAQKATAGIQADIAKRIAILTDKQGAAHRKMLEVRQRTEETWEELKTGTGKTWREMSEALDRFVSRFK